MYVITYPLPPYHWQGFIQRGELGGAGMTGCVCIDYLPITGCVCVVYFVCS